MLLVLMHAYLQHMFLRVMGTYAASTSPPTGLLLGIMVAFRILAGRHLGSALWLDAAICSWSLLVLCLLPLRRRRHSLPWCGGAGLLLLLLLAGLLSSRGLHRHRTMAISHWLGQVGIDELDHGMLELFSEHIQCACT